MQLYGSLTSPYVRKIRILLAEKKIDCEFKIATPLDDAELIKKYNPLGKVPFLVRDDGEILIDSPLIFEYLDNLNTPHFIPEKGEARWQALRWQALADGLIDATVARLLESRRPAALQSKTELGKQEGKIACAITFAESIASVKKYLMNGRLSIADIAMGVALDYVDFRYPHDWRAHHPKLAAIQKELGARESFCATIPPR